ncbi:hypothetical protein CBS101457_000411 [Exobasidium rhododendri]|nr:hypothetical protein CBS101457_000411 [Exobasidium rhododendri]
MFRSSIAVLAAARNSINVVSLFGQTRSLSSARHTEIWAQKKQHFPISRQCRLPNQDLLVRHTSTRAAFGQEGEDEDADRRPRQPPRWFQRPIVLLLAFMPVFTFGLGCWQIQRLQWKLELIDELESKLKKEPLSLPKNIDLDMLLSNYTNRLFSISGRFPSPTPGNMIFLGPRVREGEMGYHIVQPLERSVGGGQVIVDRGFIPVSKIINFKGDPTTWRLMDSAFDASFGSSDTHLVLLPRPKERNSFTPTNNALKHTWFFADVSEMVQYFSRGRSEEEEDTYTPSAGVGRSVKELLGLERSERQILPVYLEEIFEGTAADAARYFQKGLPIGRAATVELRNQHAVYAATWFSLSAATSVMFAVLIRRGR